MFIRSSVNFAIKSEEPLLEGKIRIRDIRPKYLAKTKLRSGVGRIVNEEEIVQVLRRAGFDIVFPERLTFSEQVKLFSTSSFISGSTGSAFHTSVFSDASSNMIIINTIQEINSNFILLDSLGKHDAKYFYPIDTKVVHLPSDAFLTSFQVANPQRVALEIIKMKNDIAPPFGT